MNNNERNRENILLQAIFEKNQEIVQREQEIEMIRQELLKSKKSDKKTDVRRHKLSASNSG